MMELSNLTEKTLEIFGAESTDELVSNIIKTVETNDFNVYQKFEEMVKDLSVDWLQKVYQYYLADRKEKKQDYTPKSLAKLMAKLALKNNDGLIVDMCAGSGALTIQAWNLNKDLEFECLEYDEKVLPILIFNMAIRNIRSTVKHIDVLQDEILNIYTIEPTEKYGKVVKQYGDNNQ
ncbi:TPA: N-6 DNA methylase [Streptococcus suis]